jgi:lysophospholipase L1-like esterase
MWLGKLALLVFGVATALAAAEVATRLVYPLRLVERRPLDGAPVADWLTPGARYRQVSSEFDALTSIGPHGYRDPAAPPGGPELVFLGDSNTFGWGLADDETFAARYCRAARRSCANLGAPGTGTIEQGARLEDFLTRLDWRPREVWLFLFAMTASFSRGNDLADDYWHARWARARETGVAPAPATARERLERALSRQDVLLERSNLARLVKYLWAPWLRSVLQPGLAEERREEALAATRRALVRLAELSRERGFALRLFLLHPIQDVMWGTYGETAAALGSIAPAPIDDLAPLFADDPRRYYYPLDGHFNAAGVDVIVRHLLEGPR